MGWCWPLHRRVLSGARVAAALILREEGERSKCKLKGLVSRFVGAYCVGYLDSMGMNSFLCLHAHIV